MTDLIKAEGFDEAIMGWGSHFSHDVLIYDFDKCVAILMERDKMEYEEAVEFMDFIVCGAWMVNNTPVFFKIKTKNYLIFYKGEGQDNEQA